MNTYHVFWKGKKNELKADTSLQAQELAAKLWKVKKQYEITVMLVAKGDQAVIHKTSEI